jgi:predicted Zn-dependent peptidase
MLRASRIVCASKRGFATVVDASAGFKVAAVDNGQPSSSVTVLLKAGSRYQSKPGVAHALSNFAFKVSVPPPTHEQLVVAPCVHMPVSLRAGDGYAGQVRCMRLRGSYVDGRDGILTPASVLRAMDQLGIMGGVFPAAF